MAIDPGAFAFLQFIAHTVPAILMAEERGHVMKSTEKDYVNKNLQRNEGCTGEAGTDHDQKFYHMTCLHCGHHYFANGTDIWQRKCPKCQGGKP